MLKARIVFTAVMAMAATVATAVMAPARAAEGDSRATAVTIGSLPFSTVVSTPKAAFNGPLGSCSTSVRHDAVWYRHDATATTDVFVTAARRSVPQVTTISVWRVDASGGLAPLGCSNLYQTAYYTDTSYETARLRASFASGQTYFVVVSRYESSSNPSVIDLQVTQAGSPAHDSVASPLPVGSLPTIDSVDFPAVPVDVNEQAPSCSLSGGRTVWYRLDLTGREGVEVTIDQAAAIAVQKSDGTEALCVRTEGYGRSGTRFRVPIGPAWKVAVDASTAATIQFKYRLPAPNDDFKHAVILRHPNFFEAKPLPLLDRQDGQMSSIESWESVEGDEVLGTMWWIYAPNNHTYINARPADPPEPRYWGGGYGGGGEPNWLDYRFDYVQWANIRVFEAVNNQLGREVPLDRTLSTNGTVRWLAEGGIPYAVQVSLTELRPVALYLNPINPQGNVGVCNYNSCVL